MAEVQVESTFSTPYQPPFENPPESGHRQIGRQYQRTVLIDRESEVYRSASPVIPTHPGDHHLIISIVLLLISILLFNPVVLLCSIPAVIFSTKSRHAEMRGAKLEMQDSDKIAFGFIIFAIIGWILSLCVAGFVVYREFCGPTGTQCDTSP